MNPFKATNPERRPVIGRPAAPVFTATNSDTDFPDLPTSSSGSSGSRGIRNTSGVHTRSNAETPEETVTFSRIVDKKPDDTRVVEVEEVLKPGVVSYTLNKHSKKFAVRETAAPEVVDMSYARFIKMHSTLQNNYCDHAERFIQCYGYDCYERTFLMPNYDSFGFSDESDASSESDESE